MVGLNGSPSTLDLLCDALVRLKDYFQVDSFVVEHNDGKLAFDAGCLVIGTVGSENDTKCRENIIERWQRLMTAIEALAAQDLRVRSFIAEGGETILGFTDGKLSAGAAAPAKPPIPPASAPATVSAPAPQH